jgi:hypothetical protein
VYYPADFRQALPSKDLCKEYLRVCRDRNRAGGGFVRSSGIKFESVSFILRMLLGPKYFEAGRTLGYRFERNVITARM